MPDKRDMHKAKSHRNSKSAKQQTRRNESSAASSVATTTAESGEPAVTDVPGKKNKSRR